MKFKNFNWDNVDLSKYQKEIDEINKNADELLKDKGIRKILRKYKIKKFFAKIFRRDVDE